MFHIFSNFRVSFNHERKIFQTNWALQVMPIYHREVATDIGLCIKGSEALRAFLCTYKTFANMLTYYPFPQDFQIALEPENSAGQANCRRN